MNLMFQPRVVDCNEKTATMEIPQPRVPPVESRVSCPFTRMLVPGHRADLPTLHPRLQIDKAGPR